MDLAIDSLPKTDTASQNLKSAGLILLVSDSPAWAASTRALLESNGFAIIYADTVESSLALARHYRPDLIVGDVTMEIETASLCYGLKENYVTAGIPVLVTTRAACDYERIAMALDAGADDCLPVDGFNRLISKKADNLIALTRERRARLEAEARYNALAEAVTSIVYLIAPEWPFYMIYVSPQAGWLGYSCDEFEQNSNLWLSLVCVEDRDRVIEELIEACSTGAEHESQYRSVARDGSLRWLCDKRKLVLDSADRPVCWEVISVDITERKEAEEALRRSQERYRAFVEQSSEAIWCFELDQPLSIDRTEDEQVEHFFDHGHLVECNAAMSVMYGFSSTDDMIGIRLSDLLNPSDAHNRDYLRSFIRSGYRLTNAETCEIDRFGQTVHFLNNLVGIIENGFIVRAWGTQRDITERRQVEEALRLTQFTIDRNADAAFWIRQDGTFLYVNDAACLALGYEREQLLSMTIHDIDPIYTADVWPSIWKGVSRGGSFTIETRHLRADGSVFPVEVTARYQEYNGKEYICSFARDITARKQLERAMRQSERKYRSLFENANDVIIVFDPETDTILEANNRACETYGYAKRELDGLGLEAISKNVEYRRRLVREIVGGGSIDNFKTVHTTKDGAPIDVVGTASLIEYGGRKAVMTILRDVTEIKRLEESLIQSEKLAALGQLVSGVAHELNNPLTSVIGYTQLLQSGAALPGKHSEWLEVIGREAERTRRIVQNLLSFSRQHKPSRTAVDLNDLLKKTVELRAYDLRVNDIEIHVTPGRIPTVNADAHQLQQVFLNIIVNAEHAIKGNRRGTISISTEPVEVNGRQSARVIISDDGPGIPAENLSKVFDPFFTTKPVGQGTGLGLSISYGIIKEHSGTIRAEGSLGTGTRFIIEIPIE